MIRGRTKAPLLESVRRLFSFFGLLLWRALVSYYRWLVGQGSAVAVFRFHRMPWLATSSVMTSAARISFLVDQERPSKAVNA
jgi:hypothetical protein